MKPKERFINYTLLTPPDCDPAQTSFKQDIPIDLSTKKAVSNGNPFGSFKEYDSVPFHSPPHMNEWTTKYCFPNLVTKHYAYPHNLFPYLFINPNCLRDIDLIKKREDLIYDQYGLPYQLPQDGLLLPYKIDSYGSPYNQQDRHSDGDKPPPSTESSTSSSSSSSPYNNHDYHPHDYQEAKKCYNKSPLRSTPESTISHTKHKGSQVVPNRAVNIKKSFSYPSLPMALKKSTNESSSRISSLRRAKSECNLHLIVSYSTAPAKICAPKKLFASNYYQNKMKEESKQAQIKMADQQAIINSSSGNHNHNPSNGCLSNVDKPNGNNANNGHNGHNGNINQSANGTPTTRFYRNYRKEVLECWDNENRENVNVNREANGNSDNALDLRMNIPLHKFHQNQHGNTKADFDKLDNFHHNFHNNELLSKLDSLKSQPMHTFPIDMYRQYYYYLVQEPAFASRAAVAVAEAYAKLLTNNTNKPDRFNQQTPNKSPPIEKYDTNYISEPKRTSPDCTQNGSRAELRSADTTNCSIPFDRKRISRPLTGKHVRHGTGASPSTLVSLRNMIQLRQKLKESGKFDPSNRYGRGKGNKRVKRK